jgi:hypothetical protein
MLDFIEHWHNKASDTDFVWFPFGRLKPLPSQKISFRLRLFMSISFGIYYGVYSCLRRLIFGNPFELEHTLLVVLVAISVFFVWFNLVTAFFWNRRAKRLSDVTTSSGE